ncbi:copper homeostasis protein CutC [Acetobacter oeni]|uniref:PF03932 family protein CutC n=1 Tax=Acetobacter oeni TaxID=304077 RepID=A0A511XLR4_9PROT|nr:copper homeostasis protein CutC [Acetobacter oeni]MBB3881844.1 copper homeostasis protein [Acetobacter oeni]NHO17829.1 copper homeostasis protein CutC [Acetobacter oeni]GEN63887.1 copper homeostasis protein CutC [Acetobacter oeni]
MRHKPAPELEVCVDSLSGLHAARAGGADRIELCGALSLGGLTPSAGLLRSATRISVPVFVMIRPRAGNFVFSADEEDTMHRDIEAVGSAGLGGVVLGASRPDGALDTDCLRRLLDHAKTCGLSHATLHRAFDLTPDPLQALEQAVALGFERILTSGGARTAATGATTLRTLHEKASGRITIMAGSGVTARNAASLLKETGADALHSSCRDNTSSETAQPDNDPFGFGARPAETSESAVRALRAAIGAFASSGENY